MVLLRSSAHWFFAESKILILLTQGWAEGVERAAIKFGIPTAKTITAIAARTKMNRLDIYANDAYLDYPTAVEPSRCAADLAAVLSSLCVHRFRW